MRMLGFAGIPSAATDAMEDIANHTAGMFMMKRMLVDSDTPVKP